MSHPSLFNKLLMVAADSPEKLRSTDVGRVLSEAIQCNCFYEFKEWLSSQQLKAGTRYILDFYTLDNREEWE
jgi:hypothetical protein